MKKRPLIGVISPLISKEHIGNIVRGVMSQAAECGCDVLILSPLTNFAGLSRQAKDEKVIFELAASDDFDGFLFVKDDVNMGTDIISYLETLLEKSNKYVMAVDEQDNTIFDSTQYDDYYDFRKVIEHLVQEHQYKKIYCLTGPEHLFQSQTRLRAYMDVMNKYGLYYDDTYYTYGTFWVDSSQEYARRLISGELEMPEAIVCGNDIMAMSLIKCLNGAGIKVPEDVAVTGYDGYGFTANVDVTLTTYLRDHFQLGADAMRRLYRNITGKLCRKVSRPDDGFILGSSCGCDKVPVSQLIVRDPGAKPRMWQEDVFGDDMIYDLDSAETIDELLEKALWHSYKLYLADRIDIYMSDENDTNEVPELIRRRGSFWNDSVDMQQGKVFSRMSVRDFLRSDKEGNVIFLSPLHSGAKQFGYIAISYKGNSSVYDRYYIDYVSSIVIGLRRLLTDSGKQSRTQEYQPDSMRKAKIAEKYNELLELRRKLERYPERYTSIEKICAEIGMSRSALQKNYHTFFGTSVFDELIRFRIERAKEMLATTGFSINEIAIKCGYSSESYFMKQFKKITAMTPTEYRREGTEKEPGKEQ